MPPSLFKKTGPMVGTVVSNSTGSETPQWIIEQVENVLKDMLGGESIAPHIRLHAIDAIIALITKEIRELRGNPNLQVVLMDTSVKHRQPEEKETEEEEETDIASLIVSMKAATTKLAPRAPSHGDMMPSHGTSTTTSHNYQDMVSSDPMTAQAMGASNMMPPTQNPALGNPGYWDSTKSNRSPGSMTFSSNEPAKRPSVRNSYNFGSMQPRSMQYPVGVSPYSGIGVQQGPGFSSMSGYGTMGNASHSQSSFVSNTTPMNMPGYGPMGNTSHTRSHFAPNMHSMNMTGPGPMGNTPSNRIAAYTEPPFISRPQHSNLPRTTGKVPYTPRVFEFEVSSPTPSPPMGSPKGNAYKAFLGATKEGGPAVKETQRFWDIVQGKKPGNPAFGDKATSPAPPSQKRVSRPSKESSSEELRPKGPPKTNAYKSFFGASKEDGPAVKETEGFWDIVQGKKPGNPVFGRATSPTPRKQKRVSRPSEESLDEELRPIVKKVKGPPKNAMN